MRDDEEWRSVWAALTDAELEDRLFKYFWLARNTPNSHDSRLRQLADEAERRGQAAMVERARLRAATTARNKGEQQAISVNIGEQTEFVHRHGGLSLTPRDRDQAGSHQMTKQEAIQEVLTFQGRVEEASDRHSATYFATCGCEIQVTTQVPIQVPILRIKPCKGQLPCKEAFLQALNAAWDGWKLAEFMNMKD